MTNEDGDLTEEWTYIDHESLNDDVTFLIILFLCREAVISKITKKSARDFAALTRMLTAKYNIRVVEEGDRRRRAETLGPEVITL